MSVGFCLNRGMDGSVTVHMAAPAMKIWELVADVRNVGRFSPETFEAEWLDGATGPAVGARFRGHVRRNEIGPVYWTTCQVTACEPGREFGFDVLAGDRALNHWHYRFTPSGDGTDVTESFRGWPMPPLCACMRRCSDRCVGVATSATCARHWTGSRTPSRRLDRSDRG